MDVIDGKFLSVPISQLSVESKDVLRLLNPEKCICSSKSALPRDWRGVASRIGISNEVASNIQLYNRDQWIAQVLSLWTQKCGDNATFGLLLDYLEDIDRYDVIDDLLYLAGKGLLVAPETNNSGISLTSNTELLTYHDKQHGCPQKYNALVLFSQKDKNFVDELIGRMRDQGHKVCTEEDLLPVHASEHVPISLLISRRCAFIILIISPNFFESPQNKYYMEYAQAFGISNRRQNIIVCMYKHVAVLPETIMYNTKLYCNRSIFWDRLATTISNNVTPVKNRIQEKAPANELPYKVEEPYAPSIVSASTSSPVITELTQTSILQHSDRSLIKKDIADKSATENLPLKECSTNIVPSSSTVTEEKRKSVLKLPSAIFDSIKAKVTRKKKRKKAVAVLA